jgi:hypothetical protein
MTSNAFELITGFINKFSLEKLGGKTNFANAK